MIGLLKTPREDLLFFPNTLLGVAKLHVIGGKNRIVSVL
jgi:hypothetical protein